MKKFLLPAFAVLAISACTMKTIDVADYEIVPLPSSVELCDAAPFALTSSTVIVASEEHASTAAFLQQYVSEMTGLKLKIASEVPANKNYISIETSLDAKPESYELKIDKKAVVINGSDEAGAFYGVQTLRKSLPVVEQGRANVNLAAAVINDSPRFGYRGMHLDVARHMFSSDFVKKYIDMLALHNMNTLHWHLTEDQGWRVEIKKYPKLTEIGAYRNGTMVAKDWESNDGVRYGGFYTQDEIRDVVAYAAERHIRVIPEVDLPGHMLAALASYPELGCTGGPYEVSHKWGIFPDVLCAGNEKTLEFLKDVLGEMCELFPCEYFHIGGDECPKERWQVCPKCQAKIKELGIVGNAEHPAEEQLQSYVMSEMGKFLKEKGKKIIGWDELLEGGAVPDAIVMSWRGEKGGIAGSKSGHDVIMTPNSYLYFDYYQGNSETEPLAIGGNLPLEKVYSYEPITSAFDGDPEAAAHIIGVQANVWTEYMATEDYVEYMALPRADALSEIQWTDGKKDYEAFLWRLRKMTAIYDKLGYNYCKVALGE